MVEVFATRVWGQDLKGWPLVSFKSAGRRDSLIRRARKGDLVCLVATRHEKVKSLEKGKLLAIGEFSFAPVDTMSIIEPLGGVRDHHFDDDGNFKWPYSLPLVKAWTFPRLKLMREVIGRELTRESNLGAEHLSSEEASQVLSLRRTEFNLSSTSVVSALKAKVPVNDKITHGVPPSTAGFYIIKEKRPANVYVLRFENTEIFKIGWAFDVENRIKDINMHVPSEYLKKQWLLFEAQPHSDQYSAYAAEQRFLEELKKYRTQGERLKIAEKEMRSAWKRFTG